MRRIVLISILFFSNSLLAQEVREFFNGARMMAMGGASIAVVNDETALLSNPAALGKLRDYFGTILDPEIDASSNISNIYRQKAFTQIFDLEEVKNTLDVSRDTYYHARAQVFPSFVGKNFGIGVFGRYLLDAKMNTAGTLMDTAYYDDVAILLGFNFRLFDGRVKLGFTGKAINRIEIVQALDPTGPLDKKSLASEGVGIGADAGLILTAPWAWLPTITAVVRDVGGTSYDQGAGIRMQTVNRPAKVEQDIDVGVALFPIHTNSVRSSFTLEYTKLKEASEAIDKTRFYHVGYELNVGDLLFFRAGMNQRYWTGGVELASEFLQLQFTSYGEEVGIDGGDTVEDRRYIFKFSLRF